VETLGFLEALVHAVRPGWSVRYGAIEPWGVFGVVLISPAGSVEVVPSLVRGEIVVWSPFVFVQGVPHYDLHGADGEFLRTCVLDEAVAWIARWQAARGPAAAPEPVTPARPRRSARQTEVDGVTPVMPIAAVSIRPDEPVPAAESLADALRGQKRGQLRRARELVRQRDRGQAARELIAIARRARGDARANALEVLIAVARPEDGPELARYLGDPDRGVQRLAVDGVKRIGYAAAVPALAQLVVARVPRPTTSARELTAAAAIAMKSLSGKRGAAALTGYFRSADPRVREAACVAVAMFPEPGARRARPQLEQLLGDRDARVVRAAKRALAAL
jgi:HEAT repeat protein